MELDGDSLEVSILGINQPGHESGNAAMFGGRSLPWLQETADGDDVWEAWGVAYRDVVILDAANKVVDVYNLTEHDLASEGNRQELAQKLRGAAGFRTRIGAPGPGSTGPTSSP